MGVYFMKYSYIFVASAIALLSNSVSGSAADAVFQQDIIPSAPLAVAAEGFDWTGGYAGATAGALFKGDSFSDLRRFKDGTFIGGVHVGYNYQLEDNWVLGIEAEGNLLNDKKPGVSLKNYAAARVRAGYAFDRFLPYVDGGVVVGRLEVGSRGGAAAKEAKRKPEGHSHFGYTVGGGVEYALTDRMTTRASYHYIDLKSRDYTVGNESKSIGYKGHVIGAGFSIKF